MICERKYISMQTTFSETLRTLRKERGFSQQQLANQLFVDRSSIAHWESGRRVPDPILLSRLADCLRVDVGTLLNAAKAEEEAPEVILVDDEEIQLAGAIPILSKAMPGATITGFSKGSEAAAYAGDHRIAVAFLDIELGSSSGLDLCTKLIEINPRTNVVFLTSYPDYAIEAWKTSASGFLVKPLHVEDVEQQIGKLRYPVRGLR